MGSDGELDTQQELSIRLFLIAGDDRADLRVRTSEVGRITTVCFNCQRCTSSIARLEVSTPSFIVRLVTSYTLHPPRCSRHREESSVTVFS
jgi:hypothetical protein